MTVPFDGLTGLPVLLRFESNFNRDTTQSIIGLVTEASKPEAYIDAENGDRYRIHWGGRVDRRTGDGVWTSYGVDGRLWYLEEVDHTPDMDEDEIADEDERSPDPFIN